MVFGRILSMENWVVNEKRTKNAKNPCYSILLCATRQL